MIACCIVGHISHNKVGAKGADMNLAGGHCPGSEIPQVYYHFLFSCASHGVAAENESAADNLNI